jgi:lipopolysaccharide transport system permease protein
MFTAIWNYRSFVLGSVKSDFQHKYCKSVLGAVWVTINPLYMIAIYTVIFSNVIRPNLHSFSYPIYVAAGTLTWNFFTEILNRSQSVYLTYANIIKKLNFPHVCLSVIVIANAWINFLVAFGLFTLYLLASASFPGWCFLGLVPVLVIQTFFAVGLGTFLGVINIFFRDVGQAMAVILQIWFWLTPIVYLRETLPVKVQALIQFNPITPIINAYHDILVFQHWPSWSSLIFPAGLAVIFCLVSVSFYHKYLVEILDEL